MTKEAIMQYYIDHERRGLIFDEFMDLFHSNETPGQQINMQEMIEGIVEHAYAQGFTDGLAQNA